MRIILILSICLNVISYKSKSACISPKQLICIENYLWSQNERCDSTTEKLYYELHNGLRKVKLISNGKFGYVNNKGEEVIKFIYDAASDFTDDIAGVSLNGRAGYINKKGETIIEFKYDEAYNFLNGRSVVKICGKLGAIDKEGNLKVPPVYEYLLGFDTNGTSVAGKRVGTATEDDTPIKMGCIDKNNHIVIPFIFNILDGFDRDFAYFETGSDMKGLPGMYDKIEDWKRGLVDRKGKQYYLFIAQNSNTKIFSDEACTKLIKIINYNIPVKGLGMGRNAKGVPVVKVQYGQKVGWTSAENVMDDNHNIVGLYDLQEEWKKKLEFMSPED